MTSMMWFSALSWRLDTGFPWTRAYVNYKLSDSLSTYVFFEQASSQRMQPNVGLSLQWVDRKWDVHGDVLIGSVIQNAQINKKGPSGELRITTQKSEGKVRPWTYLGIKESIFTDKWLIENATGTREEYNRNYELTLTGATGVDFSVGDWKIAVGLDLPWIDVPIPSIPGMHISVGRGERIR